eukprot:5086097-Amphidinium_carterae.1
MDILQQTLSGHGWGLPCVASWNARALFHSRHRLAKDKAHFVKTLARRADITCIQEAHVVGQHDVEELGLPEHACYWSGSSPATGGLLVAIKRAYLEGVTTHWHEVVVGRIACLHLTRLGLSRQVIVVHLSPDARHSWDNLVRLLAEVVDQTDCLTIVAGDFNVVLEQADRIEISTGRPVTVLGPRESTWKRHMHLNDVHTGLTHQNVARQWLSCLDRFMMNVSTATLEVIGAKGVVVGTAGQPPAGSDHWAIRLHFRADTEVEVHPRWTYQHGGFRVSAHHWTESLGSDEQNWSKGIATLQSIIDSAVVDVRADSDKLSEDPIIQRSALLAALHAAMKGERAKLRCMMERSNWNIRYTWSLPKIAVALLVKLEAVNPRVEAVLHQERQAAEWEGISRSEWASMVYSSWHRIARSPAFTIGSTLIQDQNSEQAEAELLASYWKRVFHKQEPTIPSTPLTSYVVQLPWSKLDLSPEDFEATVLRAATTTPGPDGISYGHLKSIAPYVGRLMHKVVHALMFGCQLPEALCESYSVFLNKKDTPVVEPCDTRPIVLDNVLTKIVPGALAYKLAPSFAAVGHSCQHGFVQGRTIPQAMLKLEELAFRISRDTRFGALLCVDVKQAFPTLRRKWILEVCRRSGASQQQLRLVTQMMRPNR